MDRDGNLKRAFLTGPAGRARLGGRRASRVGDRDGRARAHRNISIAHLRRARTARPRDHLWHAVLDILAELGQDAAVELPRPAFPVPEGGRR
ncbi:hypothetical protein Pa4123_62630 [Phytohabitans aurantiacus]|uniref:Uncharacterized protein n=1 Tax=Phytohabitans aurantiacus TaxID=3016789 RepID=A0ABQ5R543_9ACTN|nr:hypothetical protein Pa4123_62630 [Phytohabitans aurantiacus]